MSKSILQIIKFIFFYSPFLVVEMMKSGFGVARVILTGRIVCPAVSKVKKLRTKNANVLYANSITLTPGTYTIDIDDEYLVIHSLIESGEENLRMKSKVEDLLC